MGLASNTYRAWFMPRRTRKAVAVTGNKTLAAADCGIVQVVDKDALTVTLPATAAGLWYRIENGVADGGALVSVAPQAADLIAGNGFTALANKAAQNTKATAKKGDYITLVAGAGGWVITEAVGIWARQP